MTMHKRAGHRRVGAQAIKRNRQASVSIGVPFGVERTGTKRAITRLQISISSPLCRRASISGK